MWFLPFIERHFPNFHFIYAVRDVRDLLNPHTSFTEHDVYWVDSFFRGKGEVSVGIGVPRLHWVCDFGFGFCCDSWTCDANNDLTGATKVSRWKLSARWYCSDVGRGISCSAPLV